MQLIKSVTVRGVFTVGAIAAAIELVLEREAIAVDIGDRNDIVTQASKWQEELDAGRGLRSGWVTMIGGAAFTLTTPEKIIDLARSHGYGLFSMFGVTYSGRTIFLKVKALKDACYEMEFHAHLGESLVFGGKLVALLEKAGIEPLIEWVETEPDEETLSVLNRTAEEAREGFGMSPTVYAVARESLEQIPA